MTVAVGVLLYELRSAASRRAEVRVEVDAVERTTSTGDLLASSIDKHGVLGVIGELRAEGGAVDEAEIDAAEAEGAVVGERVAVVRGGNNLCE